MAKMGVIEAGRGGWSTKGSASRQLRRKLERELKKKEKKK
jgi:hypothetical protein